MQFRRKASWVKMTLPGGKLTVLACHPTKRVNKAEELTYLSANISCNDDLEYNLLNYTFNLV
jgi:hypothetical protein